MHVLHILHILHILQLQTNKPKLTSQMRRMSKRTRFHHVIHNITFAITIFRLECVSIEPITKLSCIEECLDASLANSSQQYFNFNEQVQIPLTQRVRFHSGL